MTVKTVFFVVAALVVSFVAFVQIIASRREAAIAAEIAPGGQFIDVNGRKVHALVIGTGPDLVLIHGASGNIRDMQFTLIPLLTARYRVIAFDRPGMGFTDSDPACTGAFTTCNESPAEQAILLQAAAAQLGADRPIVLGQSYGGAVALAWALERPDNIAAVVDISGVSEPWPGKLDWLYRVNGSAIGGAIMAPLITAFVPESYLNAAANGVFAPQTASTGYADFVEPRLAIRRSSLRANARQVNGLRPHIVEQSAHYGDIAVPVEIVHGDADTIVPLEIHSIPLSRQIAGANLVVLPGIGHMPHHVATAAVVAAIDRAATRAGLR